MLRVRVVRSFMHNGRRLQVGAEAMLPDALARALVVDGTAEWMGLLPARGDYQHRMMTATGRRRVYDNRD